MRTIRAERTLDAPIEAVFDVLADHADYDRFGGIRRAELVRAGDGEPNGVGALRRIVIGPFTFEEAITAFEPPARLDYLIVKINAPYRHEGGSIRLTEIAEGGTNAVWTSSYEIPIPAVGGPLERGFALAFGRGFAAVLAEAGRIAGDGGRKPASSP